MKDVKSWIQSRTIWAILVALAPFLTVKLGFDINQTLADVLQIAGLIGAIIFRITATKKIEV